MDQSIQKALYVILISLGLALVFNFLFFGKLIGVSVFIFAVILLGAVFLFGRAENVSIQKVGWMVLFIGFFASMPSFLDNVFLSILNIFAILGLLVLLAHELVGTPVFLMRFKDYIVMAVTVPLKMLIRAVQSIALLGQIHSKVKEHDVWLRVAKGVVLALPILIIFGLLFSSADLAFSQFVNSIVYIDPSERTMQYIFLLFVAFLSALGFLSYIFFPKPGDQALPDQQPIAATGSDRGIEVLVALSLVSILFLLFIGFQVAYLFGGETNVVNAGFTYAEYARRGFFELLVVGMLSLLVLLVSEKFAGVESKKDNRFLFPALVLIAEVVIVIISAFKRLSLYIDAYGMTMLRFYVAAFIGLLLVWFILLAIKFIKTKREEFYTFSGLISIALFLVVMNLVNPDAFIARYNLEQYNQNGKIDASYIRELSADATPVVIEMYNKVDVADKEIMREILQKQKEALETHQDNWQSMNLSRARALKLLQQEFGE